MAVGEAINLGPQAVFFEYFGVGGQCRQRAIGQVLLALHRVSLALNDLLGLEAA